MKSAQIEIELDRFDTTHLLEKVTKDKETLIVSDALS